MTAVPTAIDTVELAKALVRRPSVTPVDAGAMDLLQGILEGLGFLCRRMKFGEVENLYARRGDSGPNFCFAGHTDVVPVGDAAAWREQPFGGEEVEGMLHGRGVVDMKGAVAAFVAAVAQILAEGEPKGSISLLITGDEEGPGIDGTRRVVEQLLAEGERVDHCLVGEPTSSSQLGDMIKVGRRGSLNAVITVEGVQGHVAYPHRAANPIPVLVDLLHRLTAHRLDEGYPEFQPSNLEVTDLEVGNPTHNVIPARAQARLNIRFNPQWKGAELLAWLEEEVVRANKGFPGKIYLDARVTGEAFYTEPGPFTDLVAAAVRDETGRTPELSTSGGTSDARFIRDLCPVVEMGLVGTTMHMVDERAPVAELRALEHVYAGVLRRYFETFRAS
jgi:succinyl-diaminopimelate desuccinylase